MKHLGGSQWNAGAGRKGVSWGKTPGRFGAVLVSGALVLGLAGGQTPSTKAAQVASAAQAAKVDPGISRASGATVSVIVQASPGLTAEASAAVKAHGGTVGVALPVVDGFQATISAGALPALAASSSVMAITANRQAQFAQASSDSTSSQSDFTTSTGAQQAWSAGDTGKGVGVAIIDTGVSNMNDLSGRVVWGPDLSGEPSNVDTFGHGTVMAGVIGGSGADSASSPSGANSGVAPGATIIAVKTAGYNGVVDVSTILQAMTWVDLTRAQFNIRVLNLSWGTPSTQNPTIDPLNFAVERLWDDGIVVVVAAGNGGPETRSITKPGDDPKVLTVGAYNDENLTIPAWSSRGPTRAGVAKPDLVAPGRTLVATRSFGSNVEVNNPKALVSPSYIKGSGTSEATAVTSGLAALLIAAHPSYTPDQVKAVLVGTASPLRGYSRDAQGAGRVQVAAALAAAPGPAVWQATVATGLGSIEASRAGNHVTAFCNGEPTVIRGEMNVSCQPWDPAAFTGGSWTGGSWTGGSWTGGSWTGGSWTGGSWTGG
ncbi:MAG TPA: S8 family serine peptidase, partial [Acidimicrobiales bacterium]|nr:S8 family serine peptidase [Acidimicrobiales bacterium]